MVTLITEQLQKQSLNGHTFHRSFSLSVPLPEPHSPGVCWPTYGLMPESSYWQLCPPSKPNLPGALSSSFPPGPVPLGPEGDAPNRPLVPSTSATNLSLPGAPPPPPPPPKRHCRSLSVPEDLSRCRYTWRPSASRIWTPVKRRCHSGGVGAGGSCPLRGPAPPSSSLNSSGHTSSSPTFCSLALSPESPLPWGFPPCWDVLDSAAGGGGRGGSCCCFFPAPSSSCSSSPSPLRPPPHHPPQRRFSLSPVHIREAAAHFLPPPPPPPLALPQQQLASAAAAIPQPSAAGVPPSPSSACSTPSALRRATPVSLPRCHSQPCDLLLRKPVLKRRRDPDTLPRARPGLDFGKMTQTRSGDALSWLERGGRLGPYGGDVFMGLEPFLGDFRGSISPAEGLGRSSIGPLSESEEEEGECEEEEDDEEDDGEPQRDGEGGQQSVFERDCTELDLTLIEEN